MELKILTWDQSRARVLSKIAAVDQQMVNRAPALKSAWESIRNSANYVEGRENGFGDPEGNASVDDAPITKHEIPRSPDGRVADYLL